MKFGRRVTLYLFGFGLGAIMVWFGLLKKRPDDALTSWLPTKRIIMQLDTNKLKLPPDAACRMSCLGTDSADLKNLIKHGEVNFGKSEVHVTPAHYAIEGVSKKGHKVRLICVASPSETQLISITDLDLKTDTCACK